MVDWNEKTAGTKEEVPAATLSDLWGKYQPPVKDDFVFEEASQSNTEIYTIYGEKGVGKTTFALGFPGTIAVLSFDKKSQSAKSNAFSNEDRIKVYDAVKFWERDAKYILDSSVSTLDYINFLFDNLKKQSIDWIIIDGIEIMQKIAECIMRKRHGISPYGGIANLNVWKERNSIIEQIHHKACMIARKGIIYTTYSDVEKIVEDGTLISQLKVPKYIDVVMWETDVVLNIQSHFDVKSKTSKTTLFCLTSKKDNRIKTGTYVDISNKKAHEVINFDK